MLRLLAVVLVLAAVDLARGQVPYYAGPQDVSNLIGYLNTVVNNLNLVFLGMSPFIATGNGAAGSASAAQRAGHIANVIDDFGAKGDVQSPTATVTIGNGSTALTATGAAFGCGYINGLSAKQIIEVPGAGAAGATLKTTISACIDAAHVTLTAPAATALTAIGKTLLFGSNDSAAFAACAASPSPCEVPAAMYFVGDVAVSNGARVIGASPLAYGEAVNAEPSRPFIIAAPGAANVFNVSGANHIVLSHLTLTCNQESAMNGLSGGSILAEINTVTVQYCPGYGLGGGAGDSYTHVATIINSEFFGNGIGLGLLVDSAVFGGASSNNTTGVDQGTGADGVNFAGFRVEWNSGNGYVFYQAKLNQVVGGLLDRNGICGAYVSASQVIMAGVNFRRNGAANSGNFLADSQICAEGSATVLTVTGPQSSTGANDDGSGPTTPKYFITNNTGGSAPGLVQILGGDGSGYTSTFGAGGYATKYTVQDVNGAVSYSNVAFPGAQYGKALMSAGNVNVNSGATGTVTANAIPGLSAIGPYAPFAEHLLVYAFDFTSGAVHSANFDLSYGVGASGGAATFNASSAYGESGGSGYFTYGGAGTIQISTSGVTTNGQTFSLSFKDAGANNVGIGWEIK